MSHQLADSQRPLGLLVASYHPRRRRWRTAILGVGLGVGILLSVSLWLGTRSPWRWGIGAGVLGLGGGLVLLDRQQARRRIDLYQHGIRSVLGRTPRVMTWDQLKEVYQSPRPGRRRPGPFGSLRLPWSIRLVPKHGPQLRLHGVEGLRSLGQRIQHEIQRARLPCVQAAFRSGKVVRFGRRLAVSRVGLHVDQAILPWREIAEISIDERHGVRVAGLRSRPQGLQIPAEEVANLQLLTTLVDSLKRPEPTEDPLSCRQGPGRDDFIEDTATPEPPPDDFDQLLLQGLDWNDLRSLLKGESTLEDLLGRGPSYRPRRPR